MHFWAWLALAGAFVVLEILTMSLIFASFALAALIGAAAAATWPHSIAQWLFFAFTAVLTLAILRPFARKYLFHKSLDGKTGIDALIGIQGHTLSEVTRHGGQVRLRNETWTARTDNGSIAMDTEVIVTAIDGAVAIVMPNVPKTDLFTK
jgi:membrane protein implicated in regulation of membrane protease activity